jgi:hypothetical protein
MITFPAFSFAGAAAMPLFAAAAMPSFAAAAMPLFAGAAATSVGVLS